MLGNGAISWMSKRQATITLLTTKAEYISACAAVQKAIYLQRLAVDLCHEVTNATVIYQDNQEAIAIEKDFISNRRSKHIDVKVYFIQEHLANRNIQVEYCATLDMLANYLTKPIGCLINDRACEQLFGLP